MRISDWSSDVCSSDLNRRLRRRGRTRPYRAVGGRSAGKRAREPQRRPAPARRRAIIQGPSAQSRPRQGRQVVPQGGRSRARKPGRPSKMTVRILVDADACPVKDEIYKVAWRHGVLVTIVRNSRLRVPDHPLIAGIVVGDAFDAADDWIAERSDPGATGVPADILQIGSASCWERWGDMC